MFLDTQELQDQQTLTSQVCIIGAGAAGISLAMALRERGLEVLLLEAGGLTFEKESQTLYEGEVADERLHSPADRYRQRRFGGTTTIWGGRCVPFDPIDFERRSYVPDSGWPIDFEALASYYQRANDLCEAGRFAYRVDEAFERAPPPMIDGMVARHFSADTIERFSCPTDFGRRYAHRLRNSARIRVLLHASVTQIQLDATGHRVTSVTASNLQGKRVTVRAARFVLATGGLETARLLLASRDVQTGGIGNDSDLVGRYYMCHLAGTIGRIRIDGTRARVHHGYQLSDEGIYCRRRLALRSEVQRSLGLINFVARLHHPRIVDPAHQSPVLSLLYLAKFAIPYEYAKRLHGDDSTGARRWLEHVRNIASAPHEAVSFAWHMLRDRRFAERKFPSIIVPSRANLFSLDFHAEQQPNPASRVTLSERCDSLGMPHIRIDWRYRAQEIDSIRRTLELLRDDFAASGVGVFEFEPDTVEAEVTRYGAYGGHHIGTARMGNSPRTSVVDADCRVHGVQNLFVAGSATFPTSSQANPTLTIVALALRLADHLGSARSDESVVDRAEIVAA